MRSAALVSVTGYLRDPVLSPDVKEIAYVWNGEGVASDVYVQLVRGGKADQRPLRLTHTKGGFTSGLAATKYGRRLWLAG